MDGLPRLALVAGVVLMLVGGTAAAVGEYQETTYDCPPGHFLSLDRLAPSETPGVTGIPFEDLSPEQQRVFRDALRSERNMTEHTTVLSNDTVVVYGGDRYRVEEGYSFGCPGPSHARPLAKSGGALALVGAGLLVPATLWRRSERVRRLLR